MAPSRKIGRASIEGRYYRERNDQGFINRNGFIDKRDFQHVTESAQYYNRQEQAYNLNERHANRTCHAEEFEKDLAATKLVWKMILSGSKRMLNKILHSA